MLDEFITTHLDEIVSRTRKAAALRPGPRAAETGERVPLFLEHLTNRLRAEDPADGDVDSSTTYGSEMADHGCTVAEVVQGYGDICQAVTQLAIERSAPISTDEFRMLNGCLDAATADAVTEFERRRYQDVGARGSERLGMLAHELRNLLGTAMMSYEVLKRGDVGINGSTGAILGRSLSGLRTLVDRSLSEVRVESGLGEPERISLRDFVAEVELGAQFEADARRKRLVVSPITEDVDIIVDRPTLSAVVGNLVQNAFKFSKANGIVILRCFSIHDRVSLEVEDACGGLPPGKTDELFEAFVQRGEDRTGLGLGLTISKKGVEAMGGALRVRNMPGEGCVFTIDLPRAPG